MKSKKAAVEVQLNWIFVLIAGVIILMFFVGIVLRQKTTSEEELSSFVLNKLKSLTTAIGVSPDPTTEPIPIPEKEIFWDCPTKTLRVEAVSPVRLTSQVFFAPDVLKGRELITWTQPWRFPFFVVNFMYVTSPEMRYIIIYNSQDSEEEAIKINETLPDEIDRDVVNINDLPLADTNNYRVKFIVIDPSPTLPPINRGNIKNIIGAVQIKSDTQDIIYYDDTFIQDGAGTKFIEKFGPSYYAAIFSDTEENYNCMIRIAFDRLDNIKEIHIRRAETLKSDPTISRCNDYYIGVSNYFMNLGGNLGSLCSDAFPSCSIGDTEVRALEELNRLMIIKSCPLIY